METLLDIVPIMVEEAAHTGKILFFLTGNTFLVGIILRGILDLWDDYDKLS